VPEPRGREAHPLPLPVVALLPLLLEAESGPPPRGWREAPQREPTPGNPWRAVAWARQARPRSARRWWLPPSS